MLHTSISYRLTVLIAGLGAIALAVLILAIGAATNASAATGPTLGTAGSYAVIAGSTVTNTGPSTISGDLGVSPGSAVTGFPPGIVSNGAIHAADANALQAQSDVTIAYNALAGQSCDFDLTGQDLGGMTLTEGVYCFSTSTQLTGALTLNAQGNAAAVFIFQIGSTLTTASNSVVQIINGGVDCNAFWQVGSSATLGTTTTFVGNILALTSISLTTGASVSGRALARNGAATLDTNHVGFEACAVPTATPTASPTPTPTVSPAPTPVGETPSPTPVGQTPSPVPTPTPVGQTPSPTPVGQTPSPVPSPTPVGQTPSPTPSETPVFETNTPSPTNTPNGTLPPPPAPTNTPSPTNTPNGTLPPPPAPTNTPSPTITPGPHFPNTGGPPSQGSLPWTPLLLGLALISLGGGAFVSSRRGQRPAAPKVDQT